MSEAQYLSGWLLGEELLEGDVDEFAQQRGWVGEKTFGERTDWEPVRELIRQGLAHWIHTKHGWALVPVNKETHRMNTTTTTRDTMMIRPTEPRELPVQLTDAEKLEKSSRAAYVIEVRDREEAEAKVAAAEAKKRITELESEISTLMRCVRTGKEYREVECEEHIDLARAVSEIIRLDTGEVVKQVVIRPEELAELRQTRLFEEKSLPADTFDTSDVQDESGEGEDESDATADLAAGDLEERLDAALTDSDAAPAAPVAPAKKKLSGAQRRKLARAKG